MITGFHPDDQGDWVAELSCLHNQHVRHRPPFWDRPWVLSQPVREQRVGSDIDCPLCDRAEMPDGLHLRRTAGPFDAGTLPEGLRRDHRVAVGVWGCLRVLSGEVRFTMAVEPPLDRLLGAGDRQAIPPDVAHRLVPAGPVELAVDFFVPGTK